MVSGSRGYYEVFLLLVDLPRKSKPGFDGPSAAMRPLLNATSPRQSSPLPGSRMRPLVRTKSCIARPSRVAWLPLEDLYHPGGGLKSGPGEQDHAHIRRLDPASCRQLLRRGSSRGARGLNIQPLAREAANRGDDLFLGGCDRRPIRWADGLQDLLDAYRSLDRGPLGDGRPSIDGHEVVRPGHEACVYRCA